LVGKQRVLYRSKHGPISSSALLTNLSQFISIRYVCMICVAAVLTKHRFAYPHPATKMSLPRVDPNSAVEVQLLDGGSFIATTEFIHKYAPITDFRMYTWAFHIYHPPSGRNILWDVGLSAVITFTI
jgi:hypothetical protein